VSRDELPDDAEPEEDQTEPEGPRVRLTKASAIPMKGTKWVYSGRVPAAMVTILAGREGIGKSTVALDIAARLTRGTLDGRYFGKPQNVVVCATEDSWSHTIVPRLKAVNADMDRVLHIAIQDEDGKWRSIEAPRDTAIIQKALEETNPALLILDPLMSIFSGRVDTHKQKDVQDAMEPLIFMCARTNLAILGLIHVNKSGTTDALNSVMGSKAFTTIPRSVLYCIADEEGEEGDYLMCHVKCNVGPKLASIKYRLSSVRFDLDPDDVEDGDLPYITSSRVVWGEEDSRTAADVLQGNSQAANLGDASTQVLALVDSTPGVVTPQDVKAKLGHLSPKSIDNAFQRLAAKGSVVRVAKGVYQSAKISPNRAEAA
jgi:hypothetical protein